MTITVREILKQFELNIPLNEDMLNVKIHGDVEYTGHRTEYHNNTRTGKKELVYVIEGTRVYSRGPKKIELLINPKRNDRGKIIKEMIDYDVEDQVATYFNENGQAMSLKNYIKNLSSE